MGQGAGLGEEEGVEPGTLAGPAGRWWVGMAETAQTEAVGVASWRVAAGMVVTVGRPAVQFTTQTLYQYSQNSM